MFRHLVLFKWLPETTDEQKEVTFEALRSLGSDVPGVIGFAVGHNISGRGTHDFGLSCEFANEEDLRGYGPHPAHQAAVANFVSKYAQPGPEVLDFEYEPA
jgi:hypothetical protein